MGIAKKCLAYLCLRSASPFLNSIAVSRSPVNLSWCRWGRLGLRRDRLGSFALAPSGVGKDLQGAMP